MSPYLTVVIPAFNERRIIDAAVHAVHSFIDSRYGPYELIIADDGSTDGTGAAADALRGVGLPLRVIRSERNKGKGHALRRGIAASTGRFVLITDADLATPIREAPILFAALEAGADIAVGSRELPTSRLVRRQPPHRMYLGKAFNLIVQALLIPGIRDTQCGFKLFQGAVARSLFALATVDGFAIDAEVLSVAARAGYRIAELPVEWAHMPDSKVHLGRTPFQMLRDALRIAYRLHAGLYDLTNLPASAAIAERTPSANESLNGPGRS